MPDNTIDSLAIEVSSNISNASKSIDDLCNKLNRLSSRMSESIKYLRHFSSSVGTVNSAVQALNSIDSGKLTTIAAQLERLSKVNLSNLENKNLKVNVEINSADMSEKLKYSVEKSLDATKIDASALSKQLASAFELKGGAASKLQRQIDLLAQQLTNSFDGQNFTAGDWGKTLDDIAKNIEQSGKVVKSNLGSYLDGAEQEWQDFYNYFKNKKIYVSDMLKTDIGKGEFRELLQQYLGNVTVDATKGINLDSVWGELSEKFPTLIPKDTINDADQLITVLENLKKVRDSIKPISIQALSGSDAAMASDRVYSSVNELGTQLGASIQRNIASAMESANGQIPIGVKINEEKIARDIRNAINKASTLTYDPVKVNLSVNTDDIKKNIESKLNGLDLSTVNSQLQQFTQSMSTLGSLNLKDSGLNSFTNAIRRLNESLSENNGMSKEIYEMISALSTLGNIPDVSNNVNRFISSLARLANSGTSIDTVVSKLPNLGKELRKITASFSKIGDVSQPINTFVQSISRLANAGDKTGKTAEHLEDLANSLKSFFQTMSTAPKISRNTIQMTQAIAQLSNAGGNAGRAARSTSNVFSRLGQGASGAVRKVNSLGNAIGNVGSKAKKSTPSIMSLIAKLWTLKTAATKFTGAIESSMNFLEDYNYFQAAFRQVADRAGKTWSEAGYDSAEAYADSFSERARELTSKMSGFDVSDNAILTANKSGKSLGMDPSMLLNYQGQFAQLSSSMGTTSEQALKLSNALTMIGADLASVKNLDFSTVYENLSSGLVGMSRAVDKFGANIRVANLQQYAANLGIQTSVSNMDQASKAMLRTIVILDSTRYAWADMANTINMPANQLRILRANLVSCARALGNIFMPVVAAVLPYINGLVIAFQRLLTYIGSLLGVDTKIGNMFGSIGGGSENLSNALDSIDDSGISDVGDAAKDTDNNLKNATKSAKKLKQFLASYDELEIMSKDDSSLSDLANSKIKTPKIDTSAIDAGILNDALDKLLNEYQKKWDAAYNSMENKAMAFANNVTDIFKKLAKAAEPTTKSLKNLWNNGLKQFQKFTWTALKDFWKHFLVPLGKWTLGEKGLPRLINAFNDFLVKINWDKINASLVKLWDALEPFAENVGTGLLNFFDDFFDKAADGVNKLPGMIDKIAAFIKGISPDQAQDIGYKLGQLFSVLGGIKLLKGAIGILDKLGVGKFLTMLASHPLLTLAGGLGSILLKLDSMGKIHIPWDSIGKGFSDLKDKIVDYINNIDWDAVQEGIQKFIDVITPIAEGILEGIGDTLKVIGKAFKALFDALSTLTPDQLKSIGKGIEAIFAIKIVTNLASTILGLGKAYSTLGTSLAGLKWLIKGGSALAKGLEAVLASGLGAATIGAGLGLTATERTIDDKEKEKQFEEQSNNAKAASENLLGVLKDLNKRGTITSQMFDTLSAKLNSFVSGTSTTTIFNSMRDSMIEAGISSDDLAVSINNTSGNLEEFYNLVAHASDGAGNAGGQIKSFAEAINTVNPDPLVSKLYSLQTAEEQITFANLIVESSNAIDQMGGIWENGKQILGDKAIAIYQAIQDGLKPDENGFYNLGNGQMVQFGKAIDDYDTILKEKATSTLTEPLRLGISEVLPEYSTFGADAKGWFITGLTGTDATTGQKVQEAFKKVLEGINTKSIEDIGKTAGKNMTGGITKGMEENSQAVKDATNKMIDDDIKTPAQDSLGIHSPSKWFENLAKFCGSGFKNGLDTGFDGAFAWFKGLAAKIRSSIGSLYYIGWNAIIGMNNGMVAAASLHLYKNAQAIAQNISNIFRKALKIHSPSQVMMELGGFTVEGFQLGMQNMLPKVESTINDISAEVQKINTPTADIITKSTSYQEVKSRMSVDTDDFVDDIRKEIMAISSNTFDNNQMIGQAVKNALNGMAIYADGHLIGYLKEENQQFRNRNGYGLFEG